MTLYSLNNQRPAPLPFRIHLPPPHPPTRTDPTTFTAEEIQAAGYTGPYTEPAYDPKTEVLDWNGNDYFIRPYSLQELEEQWKIVRTQRDQFLKDSDWTQINDYNMNIDNQQEWVIYRQKLRDLPETQSNPFDVLWPII